MKKKVKTDEMTIDMIEGIGPTTMTKLKNAGYMSVMQLAVADPYTLTIDLDIKARDKRKNLLRCTTGSSQLDNLLKGGIETHAMTEFFGEFGSGKSQIGHTLCVLAQLPVEKKGLDSNVIFFDTEGTFRPERVEEIAIARGEDPDKILDGLHLSKISHSATLELMVKDLAKYVEEFKSKMVIIDSLISLHRAEYAGMGQLATRQQRLNVLVHQLLRVAENYSVAVVTTNQVMDAPDTFFGDPTQPVGGNIIGHASTYRIYLRKSGENRVARTLDSPYHPYDEVRFTVKAEGVTDPEDKKKKIVEEALENEAV